MTIDEARLLFHGQLVRQLVNPSRYHRGLLATQLRQPGHVPTSPDFTEYLREAK